MICQPITTTAADMTHSLQEWLASIQRLSPVSKIAEQVVYQH